MWAMYGLSPFLRVMETSIRFAIVCIPSLFLLPRTFLFIFTSLLLFLFSQKFKQAAPISCALVSYRLELTGTH